MSNKERIRELESAHIAMRLNVDRRIDNLIDRVEALESAVTLTDMGWATAEPEPSPDKAERYTSEGCGYYDGGRWIGLANNPEIADQIATALNSTPDPLLVGLVDYCQAWRKAVRLHGFTYTSQASRDLIAAIDAYLAGEGE